MPCKPEVPTSLTQENVDELTEKMLAGTTYRVYILGFENQGGLLYRMSKLLNVFSSLGGGISLPRINPGRMGRMKPTQFCSGNL